MIFFDRINRMFFDRINRIFKIYRSVNFENYVNSVKKKEIMSKKEIISKTINYVNCVF
jgi:hypothetical protein